MPEHLAAIASLAGYGLRLICLICGLWHAWRAVQRDDAKHYAAAAMFLVVSHD